MKKISYIYSVIGLLIAALLMASCCSNGNKSVQYYQSSGKINSTSPNETPLVRENRPGVSGEDEKIINFIAEMYNKRLFESYDFLEKHCTKKLLRKLADDYEYESENPAYAIWEFRTDSQDSKSGCDDKNNIISVRKMDDGWFEYEFYDGGWLGKNQIKIIYSEGRIMMDSIKKVYDEFREKHL